MKCICNNYRNSKPVSKNELEVHKRFRTRVQAG